MKFSNLPLKDAEGAILAHSQTIDGKHYRKGQVLKTIDIDNIAKSGIEKIVVAKLESNDVSENDAARRIGIAVSGKNTRIGLSNTGRVNVFATTNGLINFDPKMINRINEIDEGITIATLNLHERVSIDQIVATIKIIPFSVTETKVNKTEILASKYTSLVKVSSFQNYKIALLQTELPGLQKKVIEKTSSVIGSKIIDLGSVISQDLICKHESDSIAECLKSVSEKDIDLILVVGASATTDRRDVIPSGIISGGGKIEHFGMPVDPGNLLVIGRLKSKPLLALPGSARSPKKGGNDIILERILANLPIGKKQIRSMGIGGLLKENSARPLPRAEAAPQRQKKEAMPVISKVAGIILAAGQSRRMGYRNKLLIEIEGKTMIRHAVDIMVNAGASPIIVVTGHESKEVRNELKDINAIFAHNPKYADGLSTSLNTGLDSVPSNCAAAIISLGDMPRLKSNHLIKLIDTFRADPGREICVPTWKGKRGNPVLWTRKYFGELKQISGDIGAKYHIEENSDSVFEVEMPDNGILIDVDSPEGLEQLNES